MFGIIHGDETDPYITACSRYDIDRFWESHRRADPTVRLVSLADCDDCGAPAACWYEIDPATGGLVDNDPFEHPACLARRADEQHADIYV